MERQLWLMAQCRQQQSRLSLRHPWLGAVVLTLGAQGTPPGTSLNTDAWAYPPTTHQPAGRAPTALWLQR